MPATCKCKAGRCLECGALCRRCGCACDGVEPAVALARKRGRPIGSKSKPREDGDGRGRKGKQKMKPLEDWKEVWAAFGFTKSHRRKFPSRIAREEGTVAKPSSEWSCLVQRVVTATTKVAKILYPADANELLKDVARKILKGELNRAEKPIKELNSVIETIALAAQKSPSNSIQRRAVRAVMVKGLTKNTIQKLRTDGKITLGGAGKDAAYQDFKTMLSGGILTSKRRGRKSVLPGEMLSFVDALVQSQPDIKPAAAYSRVQERFTGSPVAATKEKEIKKRVSTLKQSRKRKATAL